MLLDDTIGNIFTEKNIPVVGLFELTYACNLRCQHCCIVDGDQHCCTLNEEGDELTLEEVKSSLDQLYEMNTFALVFSGGEALIRPDLLEILAYARKLNFRVNLYTNGTLIDSQIADEFKRLRIHNVGISLYGASSEIHDRVTGVPGSHAATVKAIRLLQEKGVYVTLKSPMMQLNFAELDKLREWSKERNLFHEFSYIIMPMLDQSQENLRLRLTDEQCKIFMSKPWVYELTKDRLSKLTTISQREHICPAGITAFNISPYGDVYPCVYLRFCAGNLRESSFSEIWNSPVMQDIRATRFSDLHVCSTCDLAETWCSVCPGLAWLEHGDWLEPALEDCRRARLRREVYEDIMKTVDVHPCL